MSRDLAVHQEKTARCMEVILDETIVLEECGEYLIRGKICCKTGELRRNDHDVLFMSNRDKLSRKNILAADALYETSNLSNGYLMIRVINPILKRNIIYKGTKLGKLTDYRDERVFMFDNVCEKNNDDVVNEILTLHAGCLSSEEYSSLKDVLIEYKAIFSRSSTDVGLVKGFKHQIVTNEHKPISLNPRRVPINVQPKVDDLVNDLENKGIIMKTISPWNSPIVVVPKKNGDIRLCIDYRHLNSITERPVYHIPDARELFDSLDGSEYFSALDLSMGYYQIEMDERDMGKTAFTTRSGQFCFKRMPFGLCGAPQSFQRVMSAILREHNWKNCLIYLDDICIFGSTLKEHNTRLRSVLHCLAKAGVKLSPGKCMFMRKEVTYLGHVIDKNGVRTDPEKVSKIKEWPIPKTAKELKTFISLCGYYRKFVNNFAEIVRPLELLCQDKSSIKSLVFEDKHLNAWAKLKESLCKAPILSFPQKDGIFILDTDASQESIGAVLSQVQNGQEKVISYASHALSKHEIQYCVTRRELLAVYKYVRYFQHYLIHKRFIIRTDHRALIWMLNWRKPNTSQYCSWKAELELYDFDIRHRKGVEHTNADAMSRFPHYRMACRQCELAHADPKRKTNVKTIAHITSEGVDDPIKAVVISLKEGKDARKVARVSPSISREVSLLLKLRHNLKVVEGDKLAVRQNDRLLSVPFKSERQKIIGEAHTQLGHPGIYKMIGVVKEFYYWPGMECDIALYVSSCKLCKQFKHERSPKRPKGRLIARYPFDKVAIDVTGPLKMTRSYNKYILGIVDHFSKFAVLVPLRSIDSNSIIEALFSRWISIFGTPNSLHSDRGSNLNSYQMLQMCQELGIRKTSTTPYYPQGDGVIERLFKTIKPMLGIVTKEREIEWDKALPIVEFGIRNTRSRRTGFTPNEVVFGKNLMWKENNDLPKQITNNEEGSMGSYVNLLIRKIKTICENISKKNEEANIEDDSPLFNVGDLVWVKRIGAKSGSILYDGPFMIKDRIGLNAYRMLTNDGRVLDRNAIYLKLDKRSCAKINYQKTSEHTSVNSSSTRTKSIVSRSTTPHVERRSPRRTTRTRQPPVRYGFDDT